MDKAAGIPVTPPVHDLEVSVVIPSYNENTVIGNTIDLLHEYINSNFEDWEIVLVNDGSKDGTGDTIRKHAAGKKNAKLVTYTENRGRGYALRMGINAAGGRYVITTEADLSWGLDILKTIHSELVNSDADIVIASPFSPGGGMKKVPFIRRMASMGANKFVSRLLIGKVSMATGMTRGYRAEVFQKINPVSDGKFFHVETIIRALSTGLKTREVPAVLSWEDMEKERGKRNNIISLLKSSLMHLSKMMGMRKEIAGARGKNG